MSIASVTAPRYRKDGITSVMETDGTNLGLLDNFSMVVGGVERAHGLRERNFLFCEGAGIFLIARIMVKQTGGGGDEAKEDLTFTSKYI